MQIYIYIYIIQIRPVAVCTLCMQGQVNVFGGLRKKLKLRPLIFKYDLKKIKYYLNFIVLF